MSTCDLNAERYLLGCMTYGTEYLSEVFAAGIEDDFTLRENKIVFELMKKDFENSEVITQQSFFIRHGAMLKDLGVNWIWLTDVLPHIEDCRTAIRKLKATTKARKLLALSDTIRREIDVGKDINELRAIVENELSKMETSSTRSYIGPKDMAASILDVVASRMDSDTRNKKCIHTGFGKLNRVIQGLESGDLVILSGGTGGGKSAFAMNLSKDIAVIQKLPLLYLNSEMGPEQLALRWASLVGGISHTKLREGITQEEYQKLVTKLEAYYKGHVHSLTVPNLRVDVVLSEIRRFKSQYGIRVAVVDYIGRMDFLDSKNKDDWQLLTGAARRLKTLAQEQNIVIIMLAQLNASGRLAQASYMSHEADLWLNLRKPGEDELREFENRQEPWNMVLEIQKARNAPTGTLPLYFAGERLLFTDNEKEAREFELRVLHSGR